MSITLQKVRGVLALTGSPIDDIALDAISHSGGWNLNSNPLHTEPPYHITVLSKDELRNVPQERISTLQADTRHIFTAGVGGNSSSGVFFVVVIWAAGQQLRKQLGLPPKQFHVTLSVRDNHNMDKSITSLLLGQSPKAVTPDFLDHLAFTLHISGQYYEVQQYCVKLVVLLPDSHKGYLRLADSALWNKQYKLAMLSYARAYEYTDEEKVRLYCFKKLIECSKKTEWGPVLREHEIAELPAELTCILLKPWSDTLREALSDATIVPTLQLEPRQALFVPNPSQPPGNQNLYKLPRFFRWLIPCYIAIMSTPRSEDDISALASPHLGIRHVLTLTEETPLPTSWFRGKPITNTYLPIPNFHPPSIEQMDLVMRLFEDANKLPILVHCGGGKGRAGTVAACYMAAFGFGRPHPDLAHPTLSATEAVAQLRAIRPGSIETSQQEAFVSKWCSTIWKRQSIYPELSSEPSPCPLEVEGKLGDYNDLFMLVGLPGSGKSWLSKSLLTRNPFRWIHISQDDSGSRMSCETEIGRAHGRVLFDRCNTAASDRKLWLELAANWCTAPVCVWFDYDQELCISRAQMRAGHPTLPPGKRVRSAVDQMHKVFVKPTLQEGFKTIVTIKSFAAMQELVDLLSPPVTLLKFPRTPHLINLGAATEDDIVIPTTVSLPEGHVVITEKIDGANMGFSLSADRTEIITQNRSHYVNSTSHEQFKKLGLWIDRHREDLYKILDRDPYFAQRYILYGEWLFATHSIPYSHLPDHVLAFDIYDRSSQTWADRKTLLRLLASTSIHTVPVLHEGNMPSEKELLEMIQMPSNFYDGRVEGVYVKVERSSCVVSRSKVVRKDFIAGNEHWSKGNMRVNGLALEAEPT
ncbi:ATP dependent DNA ligase [Crucibulum laeve]|uniref:ATP dependent DNA ligase n=1 Tax=Crucibulum laeve TaxID=68775 RepID=A0A5C3MA60_9AGAR|nr:ATP dependent DNA ligase [Crucibulum laeve]